MTFEEYWNNLPDFYRSPFDNVKAAAEKAFNEATKIERERCAELCDALPANDPKGAWFNDDMAASARECAAAIRAS